MSSLREESLKKLREDNVYKNLVELRKSLKPGEIVEGYFETLNYTSEKQRKSPISGESVFGK